ncbi:MAG: branched-chain amino acid ABC transporter substrate-binding protein [Coriobacteriia bacterium]|nr:branched-chain amino acid ABC transporter substrate-binding protein [Coriobacteriia bacterium]MBN2821933.1 branched-chain amino acid ABC transporter substrate-binding protein [Coriobacteriia bacterium]
MTIGKSKRFFALVAVLASLTMVVTGCGGTSADTTDGDAGSEMVEIKIGVSSPFTGDVAALGLGIKNGATLAIDEANNDPELAELGIKISGFFVDDAADPKTGVTAANQMVSDSAVVGVVAHLNSGVSIPTSAVYNEAGIVQVSPASTNPALTEQGFANVFRVCTIDTVQGSFAGDFAIDMLGATKVAVIDDSTPYGEGLAAEFAKQFAARGGEVVATEKIQLKDQDFKALVTKIQALDPDMIYVGGMYTEAALISKQAKEAGLDVPTMGGDGLYTQQFVDIAGAANAEGDLATSVGLPLDLQPKGVDFKAAFEATFPGQTIEAYDTYAYDAAMVIVEAIKQVAADMGADQVATPAGKQAVIEAVAAINYAGVTGDVSFDEKGDTTNKAITAYVVKDGAFVPYEQ